MNGHRFFGIVAVVAFALCYLTILLGGNVMASDSGLGCPDWPTCHGTLTPQLTGATAVEFSHRVAAGLLAFSVLLLTFAAVRFEASRPVLRRLAYAASVLVVGEALLGGIVVDSSLAIDFVLLHFFLATLLFGLLLGLAALANLRNVPRHWIDWAWQATDERSRAVAPASLGPERAPAPAPGPSADP